MRKTLNFSMSLNTHTNICRIRQYIFYCMYLITESSIIAKVQSFLTFYGCQPQTRSKACMYKYLKHQCLFLSLNNFLTQLATLFFMRFVNNRKNKEYNLLKGTCLQISNLPDLNL